MCFIYKVLITPCLYVLSMRNLNTAFSSDPMLSFNPTSLGILRQEIMSSFDVRIATCQTSRAKMSQNCVYSTDARTAWPKGTTVRQAHFVEVAHSIAVRFGVHRQKRALQKRVRSL